MGQFTFLLPSDWSFERRTASTILVVGLDGVPWPAKITKTENFITVVRNRDESGHIFVAYPFEEFGELVISTGTLPESPRPYRLLLELARGTANRVRNQLSNWQEGGLEINATIEALLESSVTKLGEAILKKDIPASDQLARESLELSMKAIFQLSADFGRQIFPLRREQINCPKFWIGCGIKPDTIEKHRTDLDFVDIVQVPFDKQISTKVSNSIVGPILDASAGGMPNEWEQLSDFEERQMVILKACRETLHDLPASAKLLHVVSGLNGMGHRFLSYPQQLQITLDLLELIENSAHPIPTMVSFDSPWGERLAWSVGGVHPLQVADSILRRGVSVSMLGLDINLDYWPNGSLPRDPLQWIDLVDVWSQLGLPLVFRLCAPSMNNTVIAPSTGDRTINTIRGSISDPQLFKLIETVVPVILARPTVQGVIWTQFEDGMDRRYPDGGLTQSSGANKPILNFLRNLQLS